MDKRQEQTTKKLDAHRTKMKYFQKSLRYKKYLRELKKKKQQKSKERFNKRISTRNRCF